jgi:hypothetical protein
VQNGLVLGCRSQTQGLGVGRQGALVVSAFEQLVALLPQLLHRAGLGEKGGGLRAQQGSEEEGQGSGASPMER